MKIVDSFWKWLGVENEVEEEFLELPAASDQKDSRPGGNIVSIHSNKNMKVVVCEPEKFEEVQAVADHLKNRKQVVLNFERTAPEVSQRIIDFISGTVYSLDGQSQRLGDQIFLFAPSNVEIAKDHRNIMRSHGFGTDNEPFGSDRQ